MKILHTDTAIKIIAYLKQSNTDRVQITLAEYLFTGATLMILLDKPNIAAFAGAVRTFSRVSANYFPNTANGVKSGVIGHIAGFATQ